jgi:predicted DNA-binding transcriptional regulator AlpA
MDLKEYCKTVKETYPKYISKEQMRIICHISKRKAQYLLLSGLVPCENSGKLTRNYKVKTDDVIKYLKNREINPEKYVMPSAYIKYPKYSKQYKEALLRRCIKHFADYPDILKVPEIARMTGFSKTSIMRWLEKGKIMSFVCQNAYRVPKELLIQFLVDNKTTRFNIDFVNSKELEESTT